jgi:cation transport ATPase
MYQDMKQKYIWVLFLFLVLLCQTLMAQTQKVVVNISGLTCSQCSRSVEMQMKKLSFIERIEMDLKNTQAVLVIKPSATTDFHAIAKSVTNAGFSVAGLSAYMLTENLDITTDGCMRSKEGNFFITNYRVQASTQAIMQFEFIGKPFTHQKYTVKKPALPCQQNAKYYLKVL